MKKLLLLVGLAIFLAQPAQGCTIPVFRYALEKWELTPYDILIYHRGPLPADVDKTLKQWSAARANIDIEVIDLDGKVAPALLKLWQREGNPEQTPWIVVRYQAAHPSEPAAWTGPCTSANLLGILDSPARQAILAHLRRGVSSVFLFMPSGDKEADRQAHAMIVKELATLEKRIKLPEQSKDGPQLKLPLPLVVSFPIVVLDRTRPEEAAFVRMLLATEEGLDKTKGPLLFPIFGRGRVLGCLSGKELTAGQVMDVTKFLCRECSCQVKELNPGVDLLLAADWSAIFNQLFEDAEAAESAVASADSVKTRIDSPIEGRRMQPLAVQTPAHPQVASPVVTGPPQYLTQRFLLWSAIGLAAELVLISGAWVIYRWQQ